MCSSEAPISIIVVAVHDGDDCRWLKSWKTISLLDKTAVRRLKLYLLIQLITCLNKYQHIIKDQPRILREFWIADYNFDTV